MCLVSQKFFFFLFSFFTFSTNFTFLASKISSLMLVLSNMSVVWWILQPQRAANRALVLLLFLLIHICLTCRETHTPFTCKHPNCIYGSCLGNDHEFDKAKPWVWPVLSWLSKANYTEMKHPACNQAKFPNSFFLPRLPSKCMQLGTAYNWAS